MGVPKCDTRMAYAEYLKRKAVGDKNFERLIPTASSTPSITPYLTLESLGASVLRFRDAGGVDARRETGDQRSVLPPAEDADRRTNDLGGQRRVVAQVGPEGRRSLCPEVKLKPGDRSGFPTEVHLDAARSVNDIRLDRGRSEPMFEHTNHFSP